MYFANSSTMNYNPILNSEMGDLSSNVSLAYSLKFRNVLLPICVKEGSFSSKPCLNENIEIRYLFFICFSEKICFSSIFSNVCESGIKIVYKIIKYKTNYLYPIVIMQ